MGIFMRPVFLRELGSGRVDMSGRHDRPDFNDPSYVELNMFIAKYHGGLWCLNNDDKYRDTRIGLILDGKKILIGEKNFKKYSPAYSRNEGEKWKVEPTDLLFRNLNYTFDQCPNVRDELFEVKTGKNHKKVGIDGQIWTLKYESKYRREDYDDFTNIEISNIINDMIKENSDIMLQCGKENLYCMCWQIWLMCKCGFNQWESY